MRELRKRKASKIDEVSFKKTKNDNSETTTTATKNQEALPSKKNEQQKQRHLKPLKIEITHEQREADRIKRNKLHKEYRQRKREKEEALRQKSWELILQNKELSLEEKEFLRSCQQQEIEKSKKKIQYYNGNKEEKLKARRLRKNENQKRYLLRLKQKNEATCHQQEIEKSKQKIQYYQNKEEKLKASRLRKNENQRRYLLRLKQKIIGTEEQEAYRIKNNERRKKNRQKLKNEKNGSEPKESEKAQPNKEESKRPFNRWNSLTHEEREAFRIKKNKKQAEYDKKRREYCRKRKMDQIELLRKHREDKIINKMFLELISEDAELSPEQAMDSGAGEKTKRDITSPAELDNASWMKTNDQAAASSFPFVDDRIDIDGEKVLQQTLIQAIPKPQNRNSITQTQQEILDDNESWSWFGPSEESCSTEKTTKSQRDFQSFFANSTISESFLNGSSISNYSNKIERRRTVIEDSMSCLRAVIDATVKGDGFAVFGKHIAQKLRINKKEEAESNIAKLLIENVLQNLSIGIYSSES